MWAWGEWNPSGEWGGWDSTLVTFPVVKGTEAKLCPGAIDRFALCYIFRLNQENRVAPGLGRSSKVRSRHALISSGSMTGSASHESPLRS